MSPETTATPGGPTPDQLKAAAEAEARLQFLLSLGDISQANSVTGLYGDTGSGKSVLIDTAVEYCWNRYHRISRIVVPDLGGFGNKRLRLIRLGIAQVYSPLNHQEPFETMEDLSKGAWPESLLDPYTGFAAPDVRLVLPEATNWTVYCKQDHEVLRVIRKKQLEGFSVQCPTCKGSPVTPTTWGRVEELTVRDPWIKHVGLYAMDSGTGLADWAMEDMSDRAAKNDPGAQTSNNLDKTGARILSGKYSFGANTQPHYGFAQNAVRRWIRNSRLIPGMVMPPIWTFLENRGGDENKGISVFGPKIPGDAKTAIVPSWLGNCLHITKEPNAKGIDTHRIYLVNHTDKNNSIPHLAKTRAEPGTMPAVMEDPEGEPAFSVFSLGTFFDRLDHALDTAARADAEQFPDAPVFQPLDITASDVVSRRDLSGTQIGLRATSAPRQVPQAPVARAAVLAQKPAVAATPAKTPPAAAAVPGPTAVAPAATATAVAAPAATTGGAPVPQQGPRRLPPVAGRPIPKPAPVAAAAVQAPAQAVPVTSPVAATTATAPPAAAVSPTATAAAPAQGAPKTAAPAGRPPTPPAVVRAGAPPPPGRKQ